MSQIPEQLAYRPDGRRGTLLVELKSGLRGTLRLRSTLLQLASALAAEPKARGLLVLLDPGITEARLAHEFGLAELALRPSVVDRLSVLVVGKDGVVVPPDDLSEDAVGWLTNLICESSTRRHERLPKGACFYAVLQILVNSFMVGRGPLSTRALMERTSCSYPPVAQAVRRLAPWLIRHSNRSLELRSFPAREWARMLTVSDELRRTTHFVDRSGQPRSADEFVERLRSLGREDVAIGGIQGALHHYPGLDLVGAPRLDLSIHAPGGAPDLAFVRRMDAALVQREEPGSHSRLVVHEVRRADSMFGEIQDGVRWADPSECLLDLGDARLEPQAREFLAEFTRRRSAHSG